jgi:chromosomal replication initiation ATPase DnaA
MARCNDCVCHKQQLERVKSTAARLPHQFVREMLEQAVSRVFMVASAELWSGTRGRPRVAFARQVAMYLAHVAWGLTLTEVGHVFSRDRTTVAHACGVVEDSRDDPVLDRSLELLEGVLRSFQPASIPSSASASSRLSLGS